MYGTGPRWGGDDWIQGGRHQGMSPRQIQVEYFSKKFTSPQTVHSSLSPLTTPLGQAVTMDTEKMGSESTDRIYDSESEWAKSRSGEHTFEDQDFVYIFTPPSQDAEDSMMHRQLLQHSYLSEHGQMNQTTDKENLQPTTNVYWRSKSVLDSSSSPMDIKPRGSSDVVFSPSPYLVSYSPRTEISLKNLPPPSPSPNLSPPDFTGPKKHKQVARNKSVPVPEPSTSPESVKRHTSLRVNDDRDKPARSFLRKNDQSQHKGVPGGSAVPQIQVVVDLEEDPDLATDQPQYLAQTSDASNLDILGVNRSYLTASDVPGPSIIHSGGHGSHGDRKERDHCFVKSDIHDSVKSKHQAKYLTPEVHQTWIPSLKRHKDSIRSRLSGGGSRRKGSKKRKGGWEELRTSDRSDSSLLTPYMKRSISHDEEGDVKSKSVLSHKEFIQPQTGRDTSARGSFVTVKIKAPGPEGFLSEGYVNKLEDNFRANHLFGRLSVDVDEGMVDIVKQAQVYLQHLNYLSLGTEIDGVYSDVTMMAVRKFQEAHNQHESGVSVKLKVDGRLTTVTSQFLRQAFITVYASLHRLNALSSLGEYDPTSTKPEDVHAFRRCVEKYQDWAGVLCPCGGGRGGGGRAGKGVLCPHTIARISEHIRHFHVN